MSKVFLYRRATTRLRRLGHEGTINPLILFAPDRAKPQKSTRNCRTWEIPTPFGYTFSSSQFASLLGTVDLFYVQTGCCVIRLGDSALTINTAAVPIPAAGALLFPAIGALVALRARRRRQLSA